MSLGFSVGSIEVQGSRTDPIPDLSTSYLTEVKYILSQIYQYVNTFSHKNDVSTSVFTSDNEYTSVYD